MLAFTPQCPSVLQSPIKSVRRPGTFLSTSNNNKSKITEASAAGGGGRRVRGVAMEVGEKRELERKKRKLT